MNLKRTGTLRAAISQNRWDLAAHTLILATLQVNKRENGKKRMRRRLMASPPQNKRGK